MLPRVLGIWDLDLEEAATRLGVDHTFQLDLVVTRHWSLLPPQPLVLESGSLGIPCRPNQVDC